MIRRPPRSTRTDTLFPYTTLFLSAGDVGVRLVVEVLLIIERSRPRAIVDGRWIVAQGGVVHREVDRVEPEAVDSPVEPEARDVEQGVLHRRIGDIEIRSEGRRVGNKCVSTCRYRW